MLSNLFGQFLLERGAIDPDQLGQALDFQIANKRVLGELALEQGLLDEEAISRIVRHQRHEDKDFGGIAVELGLISEDTLEDLLKEQQRSNLRLGEVLVKLDILSQQDLEVELAAFEEIRAVEAREVIDEERIFKENPALGFYNLATRILPRMTRGLFIAGGFYPTISVSGFQHGFSQRVRGSLDVEAVFMFSSELFPLLGGSVVHDGEQIARGKSRIQYERAIKSMIDIVMQLFIMQQENFGLKFDLPTAPRTIKEGAYLKRREKGKNTGCVDVILISPHGPGGEMLEFNICLIFS